MRLINMVESIGKWNRAIGWAWIAVTVIIGMYSAMNIENWMKMAAQSPDQAQQIEFMRSMVRHSHAMGIVGSVMNIVYGNRIDDVPLTENLQLAGGVLAIIGMIGVTFVWLGMVAGAPQLLAALVGIVWIAAFAIMTYGELQT